MRGIAWRRHIEERVVRRRLCRVRGCSFYRFADANGIARQMPGVIEFYGTRHAHRAKAGNIFGGGKRARYGRRYSDCDKWDTHGPGSSRLLDKSELRDIMIEYYVER